MLLFLNDEGAKMVKHILESLGLAVLNIDFYNWATIKIVFT